MKTSDLATNSGTPNTTGKGKSPNSLRSSSSELGLLFKVCNTCKVEKPSTDFHKHRRKKDGLRHKCKECAIKTSKKHYEENRESKLEYRKIYYEENKERIKELKKEYYKENREEILKSNKKYGKEYRQSNKGKINAKTARRRAKKLNATPDWLTEFDNEYMKSLYTQAKKFDNHVDHIVPLLNDNVCGLHVPWNLDILTPEENMAKSNSFDGTYNNEGWKNG